MGKLRWHITQKKTICIFICTCVSVSVCMCLCMRPYETKATAMQRILQDSQGHQIDRMSSLNIWFDMIILMHTITTDRAMDSTMHTNLAGMEHEIEMCIQFAWEKEQNMHETWESFSTFYDYYDVFIFLLLEACRQLHCFFFHFGSSFSSVPTDDAMLHNIYAKIW